MCIKVVQTVGMKTIVLQQPVEQVLPFCTSDGYFVAGLAGCIE